MAREQGAAVVVSGGGPSSDRPHLRARRRPLQRSTEAGLVVALLALLALIYALEPSHRFFRPTNLVELAHTAAPYGLLAVGAAVVIVAGGIDLSVGAVVALSAVLAAKLLNGGLPGAPTSSRDPLSPGLSGAAIAIVLLAGAAVGLVHAFLINRLKLPPFIATLATMVGLRSLATVLSDNGTINVPWPTFRALGRDPALAIGAFLAVAVLGGTALGTTVLGRHLYALGGNEAAARLCGLPVRRLKAIAYVVSGTLAALAGVLFCGRIGQANSSLGVGYELFAITAAVVGGCRLSGGVGTIHGTVLGLALLQVVLKGTALVFTQVDPSRIEGLVLGIVVVVAVAVNQRIGASERV